MKKYLKPLLWILIFAVFLFVAGTYKTTEIQMRAVIIGLGIDYVDDSYEITAEALSPAASNTGSGNTGSSSATLLAGKGETVMMALQDIYRASGRNPSLGQASVMVLGESMFNRDIRDCLALFQMSDAFKDGVIVASCKGQAKEIFQNITPIDNMVTFALQKIIINSAKNTGTPSNNICRFLERQLHGSFASYVCRIEFVPEESGGEPEGGGQSSESGGGGGKKKGLFDCTKLDVFKEGRYVATVNSEDSKGYVLLEEKRGHSVFVIDGLKNRFGVEGKLTAEIVSKNIKSKFSMRGGVPTAEFEIKARIKQAYIDSGGYVMNLLPVYRDEMPGAVQADVEKQIIDSVMSGVKKSVDLDCDYFGFYNKFYSGLGKEWKTYADNNPDYLKKIQFSFKVNVKEN